MKLYWVIVFVFTITSSMGLAHTLAPNQYMIWGIDSEQIAIPAGSVITEAVLTVEGLSPVNSPFYIHLLDNPAQGLITEIDNYVQNRFESVGLSLQGVFQNGKYVCRFSAVENSQSEIGNVFLGSRIIRLADTSSVTLSSGILELMDYIGNGGGVGIGIDIDQSSVTFSAIRLEVTIKSYTGPVSQSTLVYTTDNPGAIIHKSWDFQVNSLADWQVVDEGAVEGPSRWFIVYGEMVQSSNIRSYEDDTALEQNGTYLLYSGGAGLENYQIDLDARSLDDDSIGVMFRVTDSDNYYRFSWDKEHSCRNLVKNVNGVFTLIAQDTVPYNVWKDYRITVKALGDSIAILVDGQEIFSVVDGSLDRGTFALYSRANVGSFFDNIVVATYP